MWKPILFDRLGKLIYYKTIWNIYQNYNVVKLFILIIKTTAL